MSVDAFTLAADLRRNGDTWKVSLALPGIAPDKVDIDIVGRTLRVRGERIAEEKTEPVMSRHFIVNADATEHINRFTTGISLFVK